MRPLHVILLGAAVTFGLGVVPANAAHIIGPGPEVFYRFDMGQLTATASSGGQAVTDLSGNDHHGIARVVVPGATTNDCCVGNSDHPAINIANYVGNQSLDLTSAAQGNPRAAGTSESDEMYVAIAEGGDEGPGPNGHAFWNEHLSFSDFTAKMWIKPEALSHYSTLLIQTSNPTRRAGIIQLAVQTDGTIRLRLSDQDPNDLSSEINVFDNNSDPNGPLVGVGNWHHIAVRLDRGNNTASLFLDGNNIENYDVTGLGDITPNDITTNYTFTIGTQHAGGPVNSVVSFDGLFDEFEFHLRALSDQEIVAAIPEPASLALLGLGGLLIVGRRRAR